MIWYFRKSFRPSIRAEIEQRGQELNSFKELSEKIKDTEAKAALWPYSGICERNQDCLWGNQPKEKAKDQTNYNNLRAEEPKGKFQPSVIWSDKATQKAKKD